MRRAVLAIGMAVGLAAPVFAQAVDGRAAERLLFRDRGVSVELVRVPGLTEQEMGFVAEVAKQQTYYAAVAYSPGDGLVSNATVAAVDYHSVEAASVAALAACTGRRDTGTEPCVIVARVKPAGWEPRGLQLSSGATEGFRRSYRGARGEKALALSPSTRGWAISTGAGAATAAVAACNAQAATEGAGDCVTVIAN